MEPIENNNDTLTSAAVILDAGEKLAAKVQDVAGIPCMVNPGGECTPLVEVLAVADARAPAPQRRKGTATHQEIDSFCEHIARFKSPESVVFADAANRKFIGVLNYNPAGAESPPAWNDHRAIYACPFSPEWGTWGSGNVIKLSQDDFATFLDAHDQDLAANAADADGKPYASPADLMTLAAKLEAYSHKATKRERVATGVKLTFTEDSGVKSEVPIPRAFAIKIPVFVDSEAEPIEVRLRVEEKDGAPQFTIQIHDAPKVLRASFVALVDRVEITAKMPVFIGTPEA